QKTILCGDFNIRHINWDSNEIIDNYDKIANIFIEFIGQNQLNQLVTEPTRENSILDLVLTSDSGIVRTIKVRENFSTSDHKMIEFELNYRVKIIRKPKIYT
uniref:Endonuclease/exonuclease/phosphatase domain-containing protein n=1 Tax=Meloidogyne incognita TaxID=6306 RepID=A0A914NPI0_MELIC